jgi:hypothetical protein
MQTAILIKNYGSRFSLFSLITHTIKEYPNIERLYTYLRQENTPNKRVSYIVSSTDYRNGHYKGKYRVEQMTKISTKDHEFWRKLNCNKTYALSCADFTRILRDRTKIQSIFFIKKHDKTHKPLKSAICNRTERLSRMRRQNAPMFLPPG